MFETAEIGHKLSKREYQEQVPELRADLLRLQHELGGGSFPVLVVIGGDDRVGCAALLNRLREWLDVRFLDVSAFRVETGEERARPLFWRYWRTLPPRGRIGVYHRAWTFHSIAEQLALETPDELLLERRLRHVRAFERGLCDDGALLLKFWLHAPKKKLRKRLETAERDPEATWQVTEEDRRFYRDFERAVVVAERVLQLTSGGEAPWHVVESADARYCEVTVGQTIRAALAARLSGEGVEPAPANHGAGIRPLEPEDGKTILDTVDLTASIDGDAYPGTLRRCQGRVAQAARAASDAGVSTLLVFQGWDAAGKGGAIRRLIAPIDASICRVHRIGAPSDEELAHHYLWRFWRRMPRPGDLAIFDRSWYERVLVERVEGFASEAEWQRAYAEINDFEEQLCEHGSVLVKFWLHVDRDEQLRRFQEREQTPHKRHKIGPEDYRNRENWEAYELAVNEMVARTHTRHAPWHLVPANDKRFARVEVLKLASRAMRGAL